MTSPSRASSPRSSSIPGHKRIPITDGVSCSCAGFFVVAVFGRRSSEGRKEKLLKDLFSEHVREVKAERAHIAHKKMFQQR